MTDWPDTARGIIEKKPSVFRADKVRGMEGRVQFGLSGDGGGTFVLTIADGQCSVSEGEIDNPGATFEMTASDFTAMVKGELDPMKAFMGGRIKARGNLLLAMRFSDWFERPA